MKRLLVAIGLMSMTIAVFASAIGVTKIVQNVKSALVAEGKCALIQMTCLGDKNGNTASVRAIHFYDAGCNTCASNSNYVFSVTFTAGVEMIGHFITQNIVYQTAFEKDTGIYFSNGIVVSGTANNTVDAIFTVINR